MTSAVNHRQPLNGNKHKRIARTMHKKYLIILLFSVSAIFQAAKTFAGENSDSTKHRIAIFTPLYLDSAFATDTQYRFSKYVFPKYINPGLEFFEGAQLALDSFAKNNSPLEIFLYDTKSASQTLEEQLKKTEEDSVELIIAYCSSYELRAFANAGLKRNIPVINVNLPNDGGIHSNPFFVILNPTLKTQCEGIYKYIQQYYSKNKIVVFRKKGQLEDQIKGYLEDYGKHTIGLPLQLKYIDLVDSFSVNNLKTQLDTISTTLCIAGSLDENFGKRLAVQLAALKKQKYQSVVMGMPTWDGIKDFKKPEYKGIDIIFSTPFYNPRTDKTSQEIVDYFNTIMYARPSDMVMRGYEAIWKFGNLLLQYKSDLASNITRKDFNVFREFDVQPVINRQTMMLDYFENKKLYFLKWQDGLLKLSY